ncbi:Hypothetical protein AA314_08960 [Archangium gephyra]|uniref:Uncharacterized protein n=1 Tax=Archangium gephyra TaxID=48 RepID=A0AAC8QH23_9BACT|nr:Hypothetical protein AA314_08960 [Archangium gephyra]
MSHGDSLLSSLGVRKTRQTGKSGDPMMPQINPTGAYI